MSVNKAIEAVRDCCLGLIGVTRVVTPSDLLDDAYKGMDDFTLAQRARVNSRVEVELVESRRTGEVGPTSSDRVILAVDMRIVIVLTTEHEVIAAGRYGYRKDAIALWEKVRKALTFPGNLTTTASAQATGVVSGCLGRCGPMRVVREDWKARIYQMEAPGRALVLESQLV